MSDNKVFLNNEQLNNATGGYIEDDVARKTYNKEVKCPNCKKFLKEDFEYLGEDDLAGNYRCKNCGCVFTVK